MTTTPQLKKETVTRPVIGMAWMLLTGLCFVLVTALVKHVGSDVPPAQSAFLRYILGLGFLIPMIRPILRARLTRGDLALFSLRGVLHSLGVI
ncbi:MAG: EamA family transporter, partial [Paracoccaceae bacterium]